MRPAFACAIVALIASIPSNAQTGKPRYQLLDAVVFHAFLLPPTDRATYPPDVRALLQEHARRAQAYRPRPRPADARRPGLMDMVYDARENYERRLVASANTTSVDRLAQEYVDALRPCYEWEGYHDCPEREASFAEQYLSRNPTSPFRDVLTLLAAHRWICAADGYAYEEKPDDAARSRLAGERLLAASLKAQSLLIRIAAQELRARGRCFAADA
jgi:hypothetical protein